MTLEKAIEEIKRMFWGVLKGQYNPEEEEDVKTHLITNLATLTSYAKTCLPPEQKKEYEKHFTKAKDVLLKFDSAGPWFRELPDMIDTVYNVITYANMLQIEYHRFNGAENDTIQYINTKLESLELQINSLIEDLKSLKNKISPLLQKPQISLISEAEEEVVDLEKSDRQIERDIQEFDETIESKPIEIKEIGEIKEDELEFIEEEIQEEIEEEPLEEIQEEIEEEIEEEIQEEIEEEPLEEIEEEIQEEYEEEPLDESSKDDTQDLIEGIELASQYVFEQEPFVQKIESEQEALKQLANLLSALDPGDDSVISPLTEKLMTIGKEDDIKTLEEMPSLEEGIVVEDGLSEEEIAEVHEFRTSVSRLSHVLSTPTEIEDAAEFVSSIKKTIADVSKDKDLETGKKSKLTEIIEAEVGEVEKPPIQTEDIENVIKHLETRRQKAIERIQQLEDALNSEKIDEEEWQELRIKAEQHMLRVEDTLDGYKRYLAKLKTKSTN